jgi:FkbM family methyltransferase
MLVFLLKLYARKFPLRTGKYRIIERFGSRPDEGGGFIRRTRLIYGGYSMDCDLRKHLQRQFYFFGSYFLEEGMLKVWSRYARDAKVVFDVGANAGIYSLAAAAAHPTSDIYAFEPTPEIAANLTKSVVLNGLFDRLHVHEAAVGDQPGSIFLNRFLGETDDNEGMNFVTTESCDASSIAVPMVSLDSFCSEQGLQSIDLLKVDVQGNEPAVFDGARGLIERGAIRTIFFELNWNRQNPSDCPARKAVNMLSCCGYRFVDPKGPLDSREAGSWLETLSDVVAVR